tara:strand:- start:18 stop:218 length:201 start_codon:yes stop_codon:yes gene_type:complete
MNDIKKEKVNWRKQYLLDNIMNIVIGIMTIVILCLDVSKYILFIPTITALYVNIQASGFFNNKKFE